MTDKQNLKASGESSATGINREAEASASTSANQDSPVEAVKDTAKTVYEQAKGAANQALGAATDKASSKIEEQKTNLSGGLSDVAGSLRKVGETLRDSDKQNPLIDSAVKYGDRLAQRVEQISGYLEQKDLPEILRDTERFARRNPAIFVGGAFLLGFAAARFLKSSNPHQELMLRSQNSGGGQIGENNQANANSGANGGSRNANQT